MCLQQVSSSRIRGALVVSLSKLQMGIGYAIVRNFISSIVVSVDFAAIDIRIQPAFGYYYIHVQYMYKLR